MREGSRRSRAATDHLAEVAAGEADVAEQVVVELEQVGIGAPALGALKQGGKEAHFSFRFQLGDLASPPGMARLMIEAA
jgi:hypothetical protein